MQSISGHLGAKITEVIKMSTSVFHFCKLHMQNALHSLPSLQLEQEAFSFKLE